MPTPSFVKKSNNKSNYASENVQNAQYTKDKLSSLFLLMEICQKITYP